MSTNNQVAISAEGLVKKYGTTTALDGVDLSVPTGSVLGVLGPNGAGKTTAVRILATLLRPDAGHATVGGYDVVRDASRVREIVGLTGQYASVDEDMSGRRNLVMIGRLLGHPRARAKARADELLERFELVEAGDRIAKTYSGGMRRRLDLAASLVGNPSILYLDEPTTGLDPHARNGVWETVRNLVLDGTTVLLTTQYLEEADALADSIMVFDKGKVVASGRPAELKAQAGRQSLDVRPAEPGHLERVAAIVAESVGVRPTVDVVNALVSAPVTDGSVLPVVVRRLDEEGIAVTELALRLPSLDEVFLALTGHPAEESNTAEEENTAILEGAGR
jgi:oleandomycin transport system ATP-binding protein